MKMHQKKMERNTPVIKVNVTRMERTNDMMSIKNGFWKKLFDK